MWLKIVKYYINHYVLTPSNRAMIKYKIVENKYMPVRVFLVIVPADKVPNNICLQEL